MDPHDQDVGWHRGHSDYLAITDGSLTAKSKTWKRKGVSQNSVSRLSILAMEARQPHVFNI